MFPILEALGVVGVVFVFYSVIVIQALSIRMPGQGPPAASSPQERLRGGLIMMLCGMVGLGGLGIGGVGARTIWRGQTSTSWPQAHGWVVRSAVKTQSDGDGGSTTWPDISYHYTVNGREFTGDCISFGNGGKPSGRLAAVRCVRQYPAGAAVTVAYQPDQPTVAVLEPGLNRRSFMGLTGGLFVVCAALYGVWMYRHRLQFFAPTVRLTDRILPSALGCGAFIIFMIWLQQG